MSEVPTCAGRAAGLRSGAQATCQHGVARTAEDAHPHTPEVGQGIEQDAQRGQQPDPACEERTTLAGPQRRICLEAPSSGM
jgi:hypothetical protein